jgi:hypothetical protein
VREHTGRLCNVKLKWKDVFVILYNANMNNVVCKSGNVYIINMYIWKYSQYKTSSYPRNRLKFIHDVDQHRSYATPATVKVRIPRKIMTAYVKTFIDTSKPVYMNFSAQLEWPFLKQPPSSKIKWTILWL